MPAGPTDTQGEPHTRGRAQADEPPAGPTASDRSDGTSPLVVGEGTLMLVVGPSGAGKDTLIGYARERLADRDDVHFVRRIVTRTADAALEDHDSLSPEAFAACAERGDFALHWQAHGLSYGLPCGIDGAIAAGATVVANVSRLAIASARRRYARVTVVLVTAPPDVLAARIANRGREAGAAVAARLSRTVPPALGDAVEIDNSGPVERAGEAFVALIGPRRQSRSGSL